MTKVNMRVAVIQMNSNNSKQDNIKKAERLCLEAVKRGAEFIVLPETFNFRGQVSDPKQISESIPGPSLKPLIAIAKENAVWILAGSIWELIDGEEKVFNASALIDSKGEIQVVYRKIHLFDADIEGKSIRESKYFKPGENPIMGEISSIPIGIAICYDLRFQGLFQHYSQNGARIICIPSSFTKKTGEVDWVYLLRERAKKTGCIIIAPNQCGVGLEGVPTYGHSLIMDSNGNVLAQASETEEEVILVNI